MTYCDLSDETYTRGRPASLAEKRAWGCLQVYDSNTPGCNYLCVAVSQLEPSDGFAHIRINLQQAKKLCAALQKFIDYATRN